MHSPVLTLWNLPSISLSLIRGQSKNTRHVVVVETVLLFAKIADDVTTCGISGSHDVKKERLDVEIQCLVVQKELGKQAKTLAVLFVTFAADLKHRNGLLAINLVTYVFRKFSYWDLKMKRNKWKYAFIFKLVPFYYRKVLLPGGWLQTHFAACLLSWIAERWYFKQNSQMYIFGRVLKSSANSKTFQN